MVTQELMQIMRAKVICIEFQERFSGLRTEPKCRSLDQIVVPRYRPKEPWCRRSLEQRGSWDIEQYSNIAVLLQIRRRYAVINRPFERFDDDLGLMLSNHQQENSSRRQYSAKSDRQGLCGNVLFTKEIARNAPPSDWIKCAKPSATATNGKRFVESDVPVHADAEQNKIQSTRVLDRFVVSTAVQVDVAGMQLSIEEEDLIGWNIDMIEQLILQPNAVRLRAVGRQTIVFIQRKKDDARQIEGFLAMKANQFAESSKRG